MNTVASHIKIMVARFRFSCPICGKPVHKGDNYVDQDDACICVACGIPARRLRPISHK